MTPRFVQAISRAAVAPLAAIALTAAPARGHAAEAFAAPGAKATLSVDYVYESAGRKSQNGGYDPYEWRVTRTASLVADLAAQPPTAMPTVQAIDSAQMAQLTGKAGQARAVQAQMAPMMADVQKVVARCGEDEACISREIQKMGAAMAGTPKMDQAMKARQSVAEMSKQDAPRYQAWRATAQKGTYRIDESVAISNTDPICTSKPRHRCTRSETRKGGGEIPQAMDTGGKGRKSASAGYSAAEIDSLKGMLTVMLPVPMAMLPYTETITSDEPDGTYDTPIARGARPKQGFFRVSAAGTGYMHDKPFTIPLKGGWRSQSGEQVVKLSGRYGDEGTLTVRWRFAAQ